MERKFKLGRLVITCTAERQLDGRDVSEALLRHARGDWGDMCQEDKESNEEALTSGDRLHSVYHDSQGTKFWIMTEADRSATTVLLPEDY